MIKKIILGLALILAVTLVTIGIKQSASAAEPALQKCKFTGVINYFASVGDVVDIEFGTEKDKFREFDCRHNGMRIDKIKTNTKREFKTLKSFTLDTLHQNYPTAWCNRGGWNARLVDLAHWYRRKYPVILDIEKQYYANWIARYAENHDCLLMEKTPSNAIFSSTEQFRIRRN